MKRFALFITFLASCGILFAQQDSTQCVIKVPTKLEKEGCGDQQIHMIFESVCSVLDLEITIYDRWGNVLYVSNQLNHLWQGKEKNPGTYYFKIRGTFSNGNKISQNGFVHLL